MNELMPNGHRLKFRSQLTNQQGQSTVEYVAVIFLLLTTFLGTSCIDDLVDTFHRKYKSYAFAVSISDPPSSSFDKEVNEGAGKVAEIMDVIDNLMEYVEDADPDAGDAGDNPVTDELEKFERIIKNL
jgi:hypothetical protein